MAEVCKWNLITSYNYCLRNISRVPSQCCPILVSDQEPNRLKPIKTHWTDLHIKWKVKNGISEKPRRWHDDTCIFYQEYKLELPAHFTREDNYTDSPFSSTAMMDKGSMLLRGGMTHFLTFFNHGTETLNTWRSRTRYRFELLIDVTTHVFRMTGVRLSVVGLGIKVLYLWHAYM